MIECIFDEDRTLAPDGQGELRLDVENLDFLRDNEYAGGRTDGYTLPGFMLRPTLSWQPLDRLKVEAGFNMTAYWGATSYHEVYFKDPLRYMPTGEKHRVNMTPFLRVHAKLSPAVDLVIGNIYGGVAHQLPEPLYDEENMMTGRPEAGIQLLTATRHFDLDAWVNWESFIFRQDVHNEAFTVGLSARVKYNAPGAPVHVYTPLQATIQHRGGEIDEVEQSTPVSTLMNAGVGLGIEGNTHRRLLRQVFAEAYLLGYYQQNGNLWPLGHGYAAYAQAGVRLGANWQVRGGYFYGKDFISLLGLPYFGTVSTDREGGIFDYMRTGFLMADYSRPFGKAFALLAAGYGAYGTHLAQADFLRPVDYVADHDRVVAHRVGVGHAADLRDPARNGGERAGGYVLLALESRFAQVDVHVYYAGYDRLACDVDHLVGARQAVAHGGYFAVFDEYVLLLHAVLKYHVAVLYERFHSEFFSLY